MPLDKPRVRATGPHLTLGDLRALVAAAEGLDDRLVVRGESVPFKVSDLGNRGGLTMRALTLDNPPGGGL